MEAVVHATVFLFPIKTFQHLDHYQEKLALYDKLAKIQTCLLKSVESCIYTLGCMATPSFTIYILLATRFLLRYHTYLFIHYRNPTHEICMTLRVVF